MAEVEFKGEKFRTGDGIALMALMRFAHLARAGADANDLEGLAALYDLLEQSIDEEDWQRFQLHAMKVRAKGDDLMKVVGDVIQAATARPTGRPSDSSGGPASTEPKSESEPPAPTYLHVVRREEESGRPDRALIVQMAQEAQASAV